MSDIVFTINERLIENKDIIFKGDNPYIALKTGKSSLFEKERKLALYTCHYLNTAIQYSKIISYFEYIDKKIYALAAIHNATFIATHLALTPIGHPRRHNNKTKTNINEKEMRSCIKYSIKAGVKKKTIMKIINIFN